MDAYALASKYLIELRIFREATGTIQRCLELTQLHFNERRLIQMLLLHIYADITDASELKEASEKLQIVENKEEFRFS